MNKMSIILKYKSSLIIHVNTAPYTSCNIL